MQVANAFATDLRQRGPADLQILGPSPAPIERIRSLFLVQLLLKIPELQALRALLHKLSRQYASEVQRLVVDIDPYSML